jgi:hypothetical protein
MDSNKDKKAQEALQAIIELDFPLKVERFLLIKKESDKSIIGQFGTKDGALYVFRVDIDEMRPMLKRQY